MRQAWLRKQFIESVVTGAMSGELPVSDASNTLYFFISNSSPQRLTNNEELLLKAVLDGALGLTLAGSMENGACVQQILRLANLSATGEQLRF